MHIIKLSQLTIREIKWNKLIINGTKMFNVLFRLVGKTYNESIATSSKISHLTNY